MVATKRRFEIEEAPLGQHLRVGLDPRPPEIFGPGERLVRSGVVVGDPAGVGDVCPAVTLHARTPALFSRDPLGGLVTFYERAGTTKHFPHNAKSGILENPEVIVVLGCEGNEPLCERVAAAMDVIRRMSSTTTTMVLSGGGFGHEKSEARRMLEQVEEECRKFDSLSTLSSCEDPAGWFTLRTLGKSIDVVLEEDSMDTLGNAVFSWFTLKLAWPKHGLKATDNPRLQRIVLVTDAIHAPRSHDIFRRVFAFRSSSPGVEEGPEIIVRTIDRAATLTEGERAKAVANLESEAQTNLDIFRLLNPLTNEFDVIENGHVRSILGQMLRLHKYYQGRWDLVRKYRICWVND